VTETFEDKDLRGSRFHKVDLRDSEFRHVNLTGSLFHDIGLKQVRIRDAELMDVEISGDLRNVMVNGVDIGPLVEAELDRIYPDRAKMRPTDAQGFRDGYALISRLWDGTVERAQRLDAERLHESVDGEWSFIQTLRHLVFATESWVHRAVLGQRAPWDPISLPWDGASEVPGIPHDREARPSLEEVLALREDRRATVRDYLAGLTQEELDRETPPLEGPGWPPEGRTLVVRQCLGVVLNEEWEHRLYAERDLAVLERESR